MASYKLFIKASAARELEELPRKDRSRIVAKIQSLADNPRPPGSEKLSGEDKYRVRQGDYRVLYSIQDAGTTVTIVRIGHRRMSLSCCDRQHGVSRSPDCSRQVRRPRRQATVDGQEESEISRVRRGLEKCPA
ncbi:MAG: type II toxin-antitoxin system RelE/ParE family toxin [Acidobacteria bacterium]|nr:type II toxin-antitoxin system RelE/ParE family toxin [Acidobacteriota bacterium]